MEDKQFLITQLDIIEHYAQLAWEEAHLLNHNDTYIDIIREAAGVMRRVMDGTIPVPRVTIVERREQ